MPDCAVVVKTREDAVTQVITGGALAAVFGFFDERPEAFAADILCADEVVAGSVENLYLPPQFQRARQPWAERPSFQIRGWPLSGRTIEKIAGEVRRDIDFQLKLEGAE